MDGQTNESKEALQAALNSALERNAAIVAKDFLKVEPIDIEGDEAHNTVVKYHRFFQMVYRLLTGIQNGKLNEDMLYEVLPPICREWSLVNMKRKSGITEDPGGLADLHANLVRAKPPWEIKQFAKSFLGTINNNLDELLPTPEQKAQYVRKCLNAHMQKSGQETKGSTP